VPFCPNARAQTNRARIDAIVTAGETPAEVTLRLGSCARNNGKVPLYDAG